MHSVRHKFGKMTKNVFTQLSPDFGVLLGKETVFTTNQGIKLSVNQIRTLVNQMSDIGHFQYKPFLGSWNSGLSYFNAFKGVMITPFPHTKLDSLQTYCAFQT